MGRPITQEDIELIQTINFRNCIKFYKNCFYFIFVGYILYSILKN